MVFVLHGYCHSRQGRPALKGQLLCSVREGRQGQLEWAPSAAPRGGTFGSLWGAGLGQGALAGSPGSFHEYKNMHLLEEGFSSQLLHYLTHNSVPAADL